MELSKKNISIGLALAALLTASTVTANAQDLVAEASIPKASIRQSQALQGLNAPIIMAQPRDLLFKGLTNISRQAETGRHDGCSRIQKGLTLNGGFLLIACEKLRADLPISAQQTAAMKYMADMEHQGWKKDKSSTKKSETKYVKTDATGCNRTMSVGVWTDRALNEPRLPSLTRNDYRQIVFIMGFDGKTCEHHYEGVKQAAR